MQIEAALDEFLVQLEADGRSPHTRAQYQRHVRKLARWLRTGGHSADIEDVTHQDLARFLVSPDARERETGGPKKATTANALRTSIRCFFRYSHAAGLVAADPSRLVRRAITSPSPPRSLTDAERERLLAVLANDDTQAGRRDHALFLTMITTGIRVGSAVALRVEDVDIENAEVWIVAAKRDAPDRVFVPDATVEHLRKWIGDRETGPLFPGATGKPMTTRHVHRRLAAWFEKAGITRVSGSHVLRHSFGQRLYTKTNDIRLVQKAMRHRSIASTVIYASAGNAAVRAAIQG